MGGKEAGKGMITSDFFLTMSNFFLTQM